MATDVTGPGERYALGPRPPESHAAIGEPGVLPETYGTGRLFLAARDPHWLYAHWDLTREQQRKHNALSADGHLVIRVYLEAIRGKPFAQAHVHPESKHWFIHVGRGGARFVAELGYARRDGNWVTISTSTATLTPPDALSADTSAEFTTIPFDVPLPQLLALVKEAIREHVPLAEALEQLRAAGHLELPANLTPPAKWTPAQERALAEVITMDSVRRVWMGSLEITELIRRQWQRDVSSAAAAQFSRLAEAGGGEGVSSITSPFGGMPGRKGFWFNVNAELVIYGATEQDATVTIGGRVIKLRHDGTFSYRFALPDGKYDLPAVAVSAAGDDVRRAGLRFSRRTEYTGEVGKHPQDPSLKPPLANVV